MKVPVPFLVLFLSSFVQGSNIPALGCCCMTVVDGGKVVTNFGQIRTIFTQFERINRYTVKTVNYFSFFQNFKLSIVEEPAHRTCQK